MVVIDRDLLAQDLIADLADNVSVRVEHHVLVAAHASAVVVEVNRAEVALVVPSATDFQRADLGTRFSRSSETQLRLILLMLVLNFVGV